MTDPTGGAQSPQSRSIPGPVYPHPDGMNDPVAPEDQNPTHPEDDEETDDEN